MEPTAEVFAPSRSDPRVTTEELFSSLYDELIAVARRRLQFSTGDTLDSAGLINETYLKISHGRRTSFEGRVHFLAYASKAMRHVLVDRARRRQTKKRGEGQRSISFMEPLFSSDPCPPDFLQLHDALETLAAVEPRMATVVDLRFFGGLTEAEVAKALGLSARTVRRDWFKAKAFLQANMSLGP